MRTADLIEAYSAIPDVTGLGELADAWHWSNAPGLDTCAALSADREHAFRTHARDSFDEGLAVALLSFARERGAELVGPPQRPLALAEGFAHPGYAFDAVVSVGPAVHRISPDNPEWCSAVRAVVPAFRCEFAGDEDEKEAAYRFGRAAGVPGSRWGRGPRPFLKARFRGDDGRLAKRRGFTGFGLLASRITGHEGDGDLFVEFENHRRAVHTVEWTDTWTLTGPEATRRYPRGDALLDAIKSILYGPNVAAATG